MVFRLTPQPPDSPIADEALEGHGHRFLRGSGLPLGIIIGNIQGSPQNGISFAPQGRIAIGGRDETGDAGRPGGEGGEELPEFIVPENAPPGSDIVEVRIDQRHGLGRITPGNGRREGIGHRADLDHNRITAEFAAGPTATPAARGREESDYQTEDGEMRKQPTNHSPEGQPSGG
jgi:hypothetical protein